METFHRDGSVCCLLISCISLCSCLHTWWTVAWGYQQGAEKKHMRHGYWIELQWDPRVSGPFCVSLSYFSRCWGVSIWNTTDDYPQVEKVYDDSKMKVTSLELRHVYDSEVSTFSSEIYSFECEVLYLPQGAIPIFRVLWGLLGGLKQYQWQSQGWCSTIAWRKVCFHISAKDSMVHATNFRYPIIRTRKGP